MPSLAQTLRESVVVLDGGLATFLESQGHDLRHTLWSARLLRDDPSAITSAHRAFYDAGADVAITASYQATPDGFAAAGIASSDSEELIARSVRLAREAAVESPGSSQRWIAGSVGPYGAMLANGAEYRGDYDKSVRELRDFHRSRIEILRNAGADVLAVETIPQLTEVHALVEEIEEQEVDAWLSVSVTGDQLRSGESVDEAFAAAAVAPHIVAVGVNCSTPADATSLVKRAADISGKPVVIYPNSGESWDAVSGTWRGQVGLSGTDPITWVADGARLVGGCCRTTPADISMIRKLMLIRSSVVAEVLPTSDR